jgi:hypothetical protein
VPLTALQQGRRAKHLAHGRLQPLRAVRDHQQTLRQLEAAVQQLPQKRGAHPAVLGRRLHEAEDDFLARRRDPHRDHHLVFGECLPVQQHDQEVVGLKPAPEQLLSRPRGRALEPP